MATVIRVSGTRVVTPKGNTTVSSPTGKIYIDSTDTYVTGHLTVTGPTVIQDETDSLSSTTGALVVGGGAGIARNLNVGGNAIITGTIAVIGNTSTMFIKANDDNVENPFGLPLSDTVYGEDLVGRAAADLQRQQGAVFIAGGLGIQKDLNVGGFIYGRIAQATTSLQLIITATNVDAVFYPTLSKYANGAGQLYTDNTSGSTSTGGLTYNPFTGKLVSERMSVTSTETSTSTTTGAFTVTGGVGIGGDVYIGGSEYVDHLYTKIIESTAGPIQIKPASRLTEVVGDIRVLGQKPIGTAPVVTNVLYVTMDGNDTNDGRALDASRACRTISGAIKSPYYQPGTQIQVSAGTYLEDNPIQLKPYTSVMGSDIRTTSIEPINKTQDLFHMNSGCYLAFMQFLNGRSGLLEGVYDPRFNRGAYATAYPPLEGDDRIDVFHSPYIQNCTNLSGPWLKDGTWFVPNQTVQVPAAVGTGTWAANTTSIVVSVSSGTIKTGMYINPGQQNPGFFNARTLMLANKPFMQEQVVKYINDTFNTAFTYGEVDPILVVTARNKCRRDTGLIVDSIALDLLYNSTSESTFAGLQYWNQFTDTELIIPNEHDVIFFALTVARSQCSNAAAPYGNIVTALIDKLTTIVNGNDARSTVTDDIIPNTAIVPDAQGAYDELQRQKAEIIRYIIGKIDTEHPEFTYDLARLRINLGYAIDSVSFDLLHGATTQGSNKQSIKAGVYYYGYNAASTAIRGQIPQTAAAYNFIKTLVQKIITAQQILPIYQNSLLPGYEPQVYLGYTGATSYEAKSLQDKLDLIVNIIRLGPAFAPPKVPINLDKNQSVQVSHAYDLLMANRAFIQEEVVAYIDNQFTANAYNFSREKSYRDAGILVENIAYDVAFGGNQKAVESGLAYYNGAVSYIAGQENQCSAAIDYLSQLCQTVVTNTPCPDLYAVPGVGTTATNRQVINAVLVGGEVAQLAIGKSFDIVTDAILQGADSVPEIYTGPGPDAAYVSAEILMHANRAFIQEDTINYINKIVHPNFPYNEVKCKRDTGLIIDSIALDVWYPTVGFSQSTFAGLQYWNQDGYTGTVASELNPTISAITYLKELSVKIVQNITTATDALVGVTRYSDAVQISDLEPATDREVAIINTNFNDIISIVSGNNLGWSDKIVPNGLPSNLASVYNAYNLLQANTGYFQDEIIAFIKATNPGFEGTYDEPTCRRDIGYMVDSMCFDLKHGGNRQSVQSGLSYYNLSTANSAIPGETAQTVDAFTHMSTIIESIVQNIPITPLQYNVPQDTSLAASTQATATKLATAVSTITNIITSGPAGQVLSPISLVAIADDNGMALNAFKILNANKAFIAAEVIQYINNTYNPGTFVYNQEKCYRDTGLIVDAVSQDLLLGGNQKSVEAGLSYWSAGYNYIAGQETTTTQALNHARDIALQIIANQPVTPQTGTVATQIINPFFQYGGDYMPQQAIRRNFNIITTIIERGPLYAPPVYAGGGLFSLTGVSGLDVKTSSRVTSVTTVTTGTYRLGLDQPTVGFGNNATLYFGDVLVFPKRDYEVEALSLEYTNTTTTWNQRKVDPIGGMGGSLVDGKVVSSRSPIQSFVYDAYTQLTQGGRGVHITNDGYAQLVSVFTIFSSVGVQTDNGGIASIVNSNANFGDICLLSKGYGKRKFSGTIYNPLNRAYPNDPPIYNQEGKQVNDALNQYYPSGYWPNNARVQVFLPDIADRPHISLVMEVEPPDSFVDFNGVRGPYKNEQNFLGFLNALPDIGILNTGTITITGINTDGIAVGNAVYIRNQDGSETGANGVSYAASGTVVTDIGYRSVTLNNALTNGGQDPLNKPGQINDRYFTLYFCGNAYYTVLSSTVAENPVSVLVDPTHPKSQGINLLSAAALEYRSVQPPPLYGTVITPPPQIDAHLKALQYLNTLTNLVISNNTQHNGNYYSTATQQTDTQVINGQLAQPFIDLRFKNIEEIFSAGTWSNVTTQLVGTLTNAAAVVPSRVISKTGTIPAGAGSAITLIERNLDFLTAEVSAYIQSADTKWYGPGLDFSSTNYDDAKCRRDLKLILRRLIYDLQSGGNYNSVHTGLSYWSRDGTHHIVELGENVRRTELFPDGCTVNFYQRSYISASGYVFEYVGAGTDYGALPQVGLADPVQGKETVQLDTGKVFFTSTDQNGDFRIGPGLVISQATGVLSGRTFTKSLFANMTPFILAIEAAG